MHGRLRSIVELRAAARHRFPRRAREVYAKVPLGAAKLVPVVQHHGGLHLDMQIVGRYAGPSSAPPRASLSGQRCEEATHVVASFEVGAFEIVSGSGVDVEIDVQTHDVSVEGSARHREAYTASEGDPEACRGRGREGEGEGPNEGCASLMQVELLALAGR